jgi:hypothetical protein
LCTCCWLNMAHHRISVPMTAKQVSGEECKFGMLIMHLRGTENKSHPGLLFEVDFFCFFL